jgi:cystathionine beta-lyase/cystathionine gamma-synthase
MKIPTSHDIDQSVVDIAEDYELLEYLVSDLTGKLTRAEKRLHLIKKTQSPSSINSSLDLLHHLMKRCLSTETLISTQKNILTQKQQNGQTIDTHTRESRALFETIRTLTHSAGPAITSSDWQSPSYDASGYLESGRQTGNIHATQNDYKRDQHEDAFAYEQLFCREYIDAPLKYQIHIHATHSGMAAFSTILAFLIGQHHIKDSILVGSNVYFEVKQLLQSLLKEQYHEVDETDMHAMKEAIERWKPDAVFVDTIGNTPTMTVTHIRNVLATIRKASKKDIYCVIDNTTTSIFVQPFSPLFLQPSRVHVITFESLNKFHQFGMDGVFGGIICSKGGDTINLFNYRRNLGTNISDMAVLNLPTPNRNLLIKRMKRIERNAMIIATELDEACTSSKTSIDHIVYPGLETHPNHIALDGFAGPFLTLAYKHNRQSIRILNATATQFLKNAKKEKIPLVAGTSFGLWTTRIYQTATNTKETTPFLRISPGSENLIAICRLSRVLSSCVRMMT